MKKSIKKIVVLLMLVSVLVTCFIVTASAATGTGTYNTYYTFKYDTSKLIAELTKNTNPSQTWMLPSVVTCRVGLKYTDFTVTALNEFFFTNSSYAKYVTSLRLPSTLTNIQNGLFQSGVDYLQTLNIYGAETICNDYFLGCTALKEFVVNESNTNLKAVDGILYNYSGSTLMKFPAAKVLTDTTTFEVPEGTTYIRAFSFYKAKKVTEIRIPASVATIGTAAFCDSTITAIHFEDGTTYDISAYKCNCGTCADRLSWCIEDIEEIPATCEAPGHTAGIRCDITGEWFSGEEISQLEHNFKYNTTIEATCTQDAVRVEICDICNTEEKRTTLIGTVLGHTGGTATCSSLAICEKCGEPHGELDSTVHSFTKYEYNNDAVCEKDGTETAVCDYGCNLTDTRIASGTAKEHSFTAYVKSSEAACGKNATETAPCNNKCGVSNTRQIEGTALAHKEKATPVVSNSVKPTCDKDGSYKETYFCQYCEAPLRTVNNIVPALGHADENGDYICDNGGEQLRSPADDCKHMCHKGGFMGFIWKVVRFFQKLFKMNPVCECGVAHY